MYVTSCFLFSSLFIGIFTIKSYDFNHHPFLLMTLWLLNWFFYQLELVDMENMVKLSTMVRFVVSLSYSKMELVVVHAIRYISKPVLRH